MASQQDWIPEGLRQNVKNQLEEAFSRFTNPFNKSAEEIEKAAFDASNNSKERYVSMIQNIMKRAQTQAAAKQAQAQQVQRQQQQLQQQGMSSQQGMMRPPMQPGQQMAIQQASQMQGMQQMRQFNTPPMPRGPPSDSPLNVNMQSPISSGGITGYSPDNRMPHPSPGSQFYTHRQQLGKPPPPQQPQQPQLRMPDNSYVNASHGSVGSVGSTYIPSLSPAHPNNSPQVSAMSPALRTPGSVSVAHSPAGAAVPSPSTSQNQSNTAQSEEVLYMEKLKQLQKYIEPLSRMINKEKNSKDLSKMKSLRDVLMDSNKRLAMSTLLKCEKVLQNWLDVKPPPTPPPSKPNQHMCQPILNAIVSDMKSPMLNHTLKRTFGPALQVLNGDYYVPESSCTKKRRVYNSSEEEDSEPGIRVPNIVQGEVARLGSKFKVTIDQSRSSNCGVLHLICRLRNPSLPSVPPIRITVPRAYPQEGPEWKQLDSDDSGDAEDFDMLADSHEKESTQPKSPAFLSKLRPNMETHINHALDHNETISAILTAWERCVKETVGSQVKVFG